MSVKSEPYHQVYNKSIYNYTCMILLYTCACREMSELFVYE